jgi:exopolysaccharide biosynthesis protein
MKNLIYIVLFTFELISTSCSSGNNSVPDWYWKNKNNQQDSIMTTLGWANVSSNYGTLPSYINVYNASSLLSKKAVAYVAIADMSKAKFSVLGDSTGYRLLSDFYSTTSSSIVMNGGFFYNGVSLSLICRDGKIICPNNQVDSEDWKTLYYPTRGAFGLINGTYTTTWTYTTSDKITYSYPEPAENKYGNTPLPVPSDTFPKGATLFNSTIAIGGGPVLIKNKVIVNTYQDELLDIDPTTYQPRSAIGITSDNKMIFFICEGRDMTPNVDGFATGDVATIMSSLGCIEAMNLDGGGSSCMLVNGKETIKPSDNSDRKVVSAVSLE